MGCSQFGHVPIPYYTTVERIPRLCKYVNITYIKRGVFSLVAILMDVFAPRVINVPAPSFHSRPGVEVVGLCVRGSMRARLTFLGP